MSDIKRKTRLKMTARGELVMWIGVNILCVAIGWGLGLMMAAYWAWVS